MDCCYYVLVSVRGIKFWLVDIFLFLYIYIFVISIDIFCFIVVEIGELQFQGKFKIVFFVIGGICSSDCCLLRDKKREKWVEVYIGQEGFYEQGKVGVFFFEGWIRFVQVKRGVVGILDKGTYVCEIIEIVCFLEGVLEERAEDFRINMFIGKRGDVWVVS